ncbi:hypothetical protein P615_08160 [Brevibacillus laterosporus PE36]|nr:hypothetical protein P615_08160 [Brevibacillus laterosporus PE36]
MDSLFISKLITKIHHFIKGPVVFKSRVQAIFWIVALLIPSIQGCKLMFRQEGAQWKLDSSYRQNRSSSSRK